MSKKAIPKITNLKMKNCKECGISLKIVPWIQRGHSVYCIKHDPKKK